MGKLIDISGIRFGNLVAEKKIKTIMKLVRCGFVNVIVEMRFMFTEEI